jgi:hypothetical protein
MGSTCTWICWVPCIQRSEDGEKSGKWFSKGLPETLGTMITILAANPKIAGEFCAVNNRGVFCSTNSGVFFVEGA